MSADKQRPNATILAAIIGASATCVAAIIGLGQPIANRLIEAYLPASTAQLATPAIQSPTTPVPTPTTTSTNQPTSLSGASAFPLSTSTPTATIIPADGNDPRDRAARTLGYANLDLLMQVFGIPIDVKHRIFVCPVEETWCLAVIEEPGQPNFHFSNITKCALDGKQANGVSGIPNDFDGMVKGFTVRPCR